MNEAYLRGFEYVADNVGAAEASLVSQDWLSQTMDTIEKLSDEMIQEMYDEAALKHQDARWLQGFIAEIWHKDTYNMDASIHGEEVLATRPDVNTFASPDVELDGKLYQMKYIYNAEASVEEQAKTPWELYNKAKSDFINKGKGRDPGTFEEYLAAKGIDETLGKMSRYFGMGKVIPSDQLEAARDYLNRRVLTLENNLSPTAETANQLARYKEVLETISDVIEKGDGKISSQGLSHADAIRLAKAANEGKLDKELLRECGLDVNSLIKVDDICKEAMKAGISAAALSIVVSLAPVIVNGINMLISDGEIDSDQLLDGGLRTASATARAFISGALTSGIVLAARTEKFGEAFKDISPGAVASLVVAAIGTIDLAIKLASGRINGYEMTKGVIRLYTTTTFAFLGGKLFTAIISGFTPAYLIGSLIGGVVGGFIYNRVDSLLTSLVINDGFTFFGLVEQDYTLPDEALRDLGIDLFKLEEFQFEEFRPERFEPDKFEPEQFNYPRIGMTVISRDLIEASKVGYVLA